MERQHERLPAPKWRHHPSRLIILFLAGLLAVGGLTACSSGGGGSGAAPAADALELPNRITLTSTSETAPAAATAFRTARSALFRAASAYTDAGTDYTTQPKQIWVEDTDALDMVNDILGVIQDSGYQNFINTGPYKALVKKVGQSEQSQGATSATSTTSENLMEIILDVSRASANDPMIIKVWVREEDGPAGAVMLIRGHFTVTRGVSAQYPFGAMEAHFKGNALDANGVEGNQLFSMAMSIGADESGNVIVQCLDQGAEDAGLFTYQWDNRVRLVANSSLSAGNAYIYAAETNFNTGLLEDQTIYFAYNDDYFKYQPEGGAVVIQDKNDLQHRVYRYKLFNADTGAKVSLNSGFPVRLAGGQYGYIGYYGLWAPNGATAQNGDTITRVDNNQEYTLVQVGGKLTMHTRSQITLGDLAGVEIWVFNMGQESLVTWDAVGQVFNVIGNRDATTGQVVYLSPPYTPYTFGNEWDGGWCDALKAYLPLGRIAVPGNASTVNYHSEETVSGDILADLTLYCWTFTLDAPLSQAEIDGAEAAKAAYYMGLPVKKTFTFSVADLLLHDAENDSVLLGAGIDVSGTSYQNGYGIGPLTTSDTYDAFTCWGIADSEIYYQWTTGTNMWNQYATVRDGSGQLTAFDPPMTFTYTHTTANDLNGDDTYNGKPFSLTYDGFELRVPGIFDADSDSWKPAINLKDGTVLSAGGTNYVVKAVEEGLVMNPIIGPDPAPELVIDPTVAAPTLTYDASKTALVGAVPTGVDLKIIKGELVD